MRTSPAVWLFAASVLAAGAAPLPEASADEAVRVAHIAIRKLLPEAPQPTSLFSTQPRNFGWYLKRLRRAGEDSNVQAVVLELAVSGLPLTRAQEIRRAVAEVQLAGKPVFGLLPSVATTADYVALAGCDKLFMIKGGWLALTGVRSEVWFYRDLLDWVGIKATFVQAGDYKGAAEPFMRRSMSPEFREQLERVVDDLYSQVCLAVAGRLGCGLDEAAAVIDRGPYTAARAAAVRLIDGTVRSALGENDVTKLLGATTVQLVKNYGVERRRVAGGFAGMMQLMQLLMNPPARKAPRGDAPLVAVVYCTGLIVEGKSGYSLLGDATMGDQTIVDAINQACANDRVKAIVLRVDSPGGSAVASERIWQAAHRANKPVVVSMGQVAASGGYYISAGADKIFAEPGTLTGSIGVVAGKIAVRGLLEKVGIRPEAVQRGRNAALLSPIEPAEEGTVEALKAMVQETYDLFLQRVAESRGLSRQQLDQVAGGRIWTGRMARQLGLVDAIGTLEDAINAARELGGIEESQRHDLLILPEPKGLFESLLELEEAQVPGLDHLRALPLGPVRTQLLRRVQSLQLLLGDSAVGVWAVMPFELVVY